MPHPLFADCRPAPHRLNLNLVTDARTLQPMSLKQVLHGRRIPGTNANIDLEGSRRNWRAATRPRAERLM